MSRRFKVESLKLGMGESGIGDVGLRECRDCL